MAMRDKTKMAMRNIKFKLVYVLLAVTLINICSCADELSNTLTEKKTDNSTANNKLQTSIISFRAKSEVSFPQVIDATNTESANSKTRAVILNEKFNPIVEGSNLDARIFLVKVDEASKIKGANGTYHLKKDAIMATGKISWQKKENLPNNGGIRLFNNGKIELTWLNNKQDIKPNENWYICGIIGGDYYDELKTDPKKYHFYVDLDPTHGNIEHNKFKNGKLQAKVPFTTTWQKLNITKTNEITIRNWDYRAIGVLLKFHIKRNTKLVGESGHNYTFASSQITASGGFFMAPFENLHATKLDEDKTLGINGNICPEIPSIENNWIWNHAQDKAKWYDYTGNVNDGKDDQRYDYKFRYTYKSKEMRNGNPEQNYDAFYVWGMPIKGVDVPCTGIDNATKAVEHRTVITAEKGSFMLGVKLKNGKGYANEWLCERTRTPGEVANTRATSEWKAFDLEKKSGCAYNIELGVIRPYYKEKDNNGKRKYRWVNPLERFARTNTIIKGGTETTSDEKIKYISGGEAEFDTSLKDDNTKDNWGYIKGKTFPSKVTKVCFIVPDNRNNRGYTRYKIEGYRVPDDADWGAALPTPFEDWYDRKLYENKNLGWDKDNQRSVEELLCGPRGYHELFNPVEQNNERTYPITSMAQKSDIDTQLPYWQSCPFFYSVYNKKKIGREFYAIRFEPDEDEKAKDWYTEYGRRYRCAYRWKFVAFGNGKQFGDTNFPNDGNGTRLIVQSRWIGNAHVTIEDISKDEWWGACDESNPLFKSDCYRVFQMQGYREEGGNVEGIIPYGLEMRYWSSVFFGYKAGDYPNEKDGPTVNKVLYCRQIATKGIGRYHKINDKTCYPIRMIADIDVDEFGKNAPRKRQQVTDELKYIKVGPNIFPKH